MINIVAISGKLCSGKSTLAKNLTKYGFHRYALADELKSDIVKMCRTDLDTLTQNKDRFRPILQYYGTDLMRWLHGEDYWVDRLIEKLHFYAALAREDLFHPVDELLAVVDDVRFPNELEGLCQAADRFHAVRVHISQETQAKRYQEQYKQELTDEKRNHVSETALDGVGGWDQIVSGEYPEEFIEKLVVDALKRRNWSLTSDQARNSV